MMEKSFAEPAGGENADVLENLKRIRERMAAACQSCGRQPEEVTLLAVTKTVAAQRVNAAIQAGVTHIGAVSGWKAWMSTSSATCRPTKPDVSRTRWI